ncbi:hypothetical protein FOC4_g10002092 [Fusarium odoratissimum]|uniref:Uncharacterized protein n=1 Tax=Fusarium oxysporum f. sp. cubense (strain race 4) TaxID=2502994 RepID=N1S436_FUSC4|nr:hypothetical protein FOC4_g10002092 [Fusarium odoratissimum]
MLNKQVGFFEYYNWNDGITNHDYAKQPFSQIFFKLNLKATQTGKGYQIQAGFK